MKLNPVIIYKGFNLLSKLLEPIVTTIKYVIQV